MSDPDDDSLSSTFAAMKQASQEKRAGNRDFSARLLAEAGVKFESKNGGAHLVVEGRFDFWPGTGLWIERGKGDRRRGVRRLIEVIKGEG